VQAAGIDYRGGIKRLSRMFLAAAVPSLNLLTVQPLIALIFGILILLMPRILNLLVAIYLILIGISGLWPQVFH
jgi:Protein of unknown function (DUF3096)